jgi:hypothetical protein
MLVPKTTYEFNGWGGLGSFQGPQNPKPYLNSMFNNNS